jgi:hypothetical protein
VTYRSVAQRLRRLLFAATVPAALAGLTLGIMSSAPASALAVGSSAPASAAAPNPSVCHWYPMPSAFWLGDPAASYPTIAGRYNLPGYRDVAYKITGQFPHATTMVFSSYDDVFLVPSAAYTRNDNQIVPDPGSVNPFVPGNLVDAPNRNYTMWIWPDSIPVPPGLKNVVLYATQPVDPRDRTARFSVTLRFYKMQPGYSALAAIRGTVIHAVSALNPSRPVRCPLTLRGTFLNNLQNEYAHNKIYGPHAAPPEPATGNKVYFTRYPAAFTTGNDGLNVDNCTNYMIGTLPLDKITVVTMHKVPTYFNNNLVTPTTVFGEYQVRWMSVTSLAFPQYPSQSVNQDDAVYRPNGQWVTIFLPSEPRLTRSQLRAVRKVAASFGDNVIQLGKAAVGPLAKLIPNGMVAFRNKAISKNFPYGSTSVPCWANNHSYKTYGQQTSRKFFAKYASNRRNMGPYYDDGETLSFPQFMAKFSRK